MKTRSASKRKSPKDLPNSLDTPDRPRVKKKRLKINRMSDLSDTSDDSTDENVSFQRKNKNVRRRLSSGSSNSANSSEEDGYFRRKKRQRLSSDSSVSSQSLEDSNMKNQKKRRLRRRSSDSSEGSDVSEMESSSSCTSDSREAPKRKRSSRNTPSTSAESDTSRSSSSSGETDLPRQGTKKSKRIRFLKNTQNSSEDSDEIDVSGLLKYKLKKLLFAVSYNNTKQVSDIIAERYVKLSSREFGNLLWRALENKNVEVISMLVRAGVDVNVRGSGDDRERTLLHVLAGKPASEEYDELALLLIEHGADFEELDGNGNTVLHCALESGSTRLVEKLLELGVDVAAVNAQGESILFATTRSPLAEKFLPVLVQYNVAGVETKNNRALEVLGHLIRGNGNVATIKTILDLDVPVNQTDGRELTLLDYAISRQRSSEIVKLLLEYGADPTRKRSDGTLPLSSASALKNCQIAALLIQHGASIHARNDNGQYPLHAACSYSSVRCIGLLLFLGAKVDCVDDRGLTPFSLMNAGYLSDANKIVIKHFALLTLKNVRVNERDLLQVFNYSFMQEYYERCLEELRNMRTLTIYNDISAYCILAVGVQRLTQFIRNKDFVKNYYKNQMNVIGAFPIYSGAIHQSFKVASKVRKSMTHVTEALDEATNFALPEEIWEIITFYSCCYHLAEFYA